MTRRKSIVHRAYHVLPEWVLRQRWKRANARLDRLSDEELRKRTYAWETWGYNDCHDTIYVDARHQEPNIACLQCMSFQTKCDRCQCKFTASPFFRGKKMLCTTCRGMKE